MNMQTDLFALKKHAAIKEAFEPGAEVVLVHGDTLETLRRLPSGSVQLVISSPP